MTLRLPGAASAAVLGLALVLTACGSDNSSSSVVTTTVTTTATSSASTAASTSAPSGASGSAALCSARDSLKTSIQDLASVDVVKNGTSGLQDAVTKVKNNLQAVRSAAGADLQPQVTAAQSSLDQLSTALSNASSVGVAGVVTAAKNAATAGTTLLSSLDNLKCT
jgi:hypothetical protein